MRLQKLILLGVPFAVLIQMVNGAEAPFEIRKPDFKTYTFEEKVVPVDFRAGPGSKLTLSKEYSKNGAKSLRWDWNTEGAWIEFHNEEAFRHLTGESPDPIVYEWVTFCELSSFSSWLFCPEKVGGYLRFQLGDSKFYLNLNFTGWTKNELQYGRDLAMFPKPGTATLRITAPRGISRGTVFFDDFAPRREMDVRIVRGTSRMPYVANPKLASDRPVWQEEADWHVPAASEKILKQTTVLEVPVKISENDLLMMQQLGDEFLKRFSSNSRFSALEYKQLSHIRNRWKLRRTGKFVSGELSEPKKFYGDLHLAGRALLFGKLSAEKQEQVQALIHDMVDLVIQQGHGGAYSLRTTFIAPVFLLKEELKSAKKFEPLLARLRNITEVHEFYRSNSLANADFFNTMLEGTLGVIFLQDDPYARYRDLRALSNYLNQTATKGEIWPDGTFAHHNMIYSGYGFPAIGPICRTLHLLRNTSLFPQQMYESARRVMLAMSFYSNPYSPHMFSGRHRYCAQFTFDLAVNLALLAEATPALDRLCAARYLAFEELYRKKTSAGNRFRATGIKPDSMTGSAALNYAVSLIHRQGQELAVVRGQRNGIVANEAYANGGSNTMGRYLNFGQMQVLGQTPAKSGFILEKGWNYNFWPATTTRVIPADALRQHFENVEALTTEFFAGAVAQGDAGMWAMKQREELPEVGDPLRVGPPVYYLGTKEYARRCKESRIDTGFRAIKSVFAFDGMMLMLGSGITATDDAPVVTTLFQNSLMELDKDKFQAGEGFFIDSAGNGYAFPGGNVRLQRGVTSWPYHPNWLPHKPEVHEKLLQNEGEMELAYFDHGSKPQDAGYEYLVTFPSRANRVASLAKLWRKTPDELPFHVIRRDKNAHIVHIPARNLTGYALFEAGEVTFGELCKVSAACIIMLHVDKNQLRLDILNPFSDALGAGYPIQKEVKTRIRLKDGWSLAQPNKYIRIIDSSEFEINNYNLQATSIIFQRREK